MSFKHFLSIVCALTCATFPIYAQLDTASITGSVSDPTGAVVAGARVTVTNIATNFESVSETNLDGIYRIQSLRPGLYRVVVTASGFQRLVFDSVEVRAGDVVAVNGKLELGNVAETVEVHANAPVLETETSSTGTVLKGTYFAQLPMYQRDPKNILYLTPGVTYTGNGYAGSLGGFHISGLRDTSIGLFEDGMIGTSAENDNGNRGVDTIMNSVEELKILTTSLPAEYGHSAGGAIAIVKKSGTNQLHGQASIFGRKREWQHRKFFDLCKLTQSTDGCTPATLFVIEPDFNLNGPLYIPKLYDGRNKTFFMFGYQKFIEKQAKQYQYTVPTEAMLNGDFSIGGIGQPIYDPRTTRRLPNGTWTRDAIPGNKIPAESINPVAKKIISLRPWATSNTTGVVTTTGVQNNFVAAAQKIVIWDYYTARVDQQFSTNFKMYGTWTLNNKWERTPNPNITNPVFDASLSYPIVRQDTSSLGFTWVISPSFVSDTRFGYTRQGAITNSTTYGKNIAGMLGIPNTSPAAYPLNVVPFVTNPSAGSTAVNESVMAKTDWTKMRGKHAFKFGYELMRFRNNEYTPGSPSGSFSYASVAGLSGSGTQTIPNTGQTGTNNGGSFAAFLLGSISSATASVPLISWLPRSTMHSLYVQDDWKILPTLTLNIGLRWQTESPFNTKYHQISNFDPSLPDNVVSGALGVITHPTNGLNKRDGNNFQPRLGLAWNVLKKMVVRAGFALSTQDLKLSVDQRAEYSNTATLTQVSGDPRPLFQIDSFGGFASAYPALRADGTSPFQGNNYASRNVTWIDPNLRNPYTMTFNLGIQYELAANYVLDVSYQGSAGVGFTQTHEMNARSFDWATNLRLNNPTQFTTFVGNTQGFRPFTNFGNISFVNNTGHSTNHSGTVKVEKRYSRGLTFLAFYTYAKSIDNEGANSSLIDGRLFRGRSSFDQTHRFVSNFSYALPFGKGRHWMSNANRLMDSFLGGWNFVWTYQIISGTPMTFGFADSPYNYMPGVVAQIGGRPNMTQRPKLRDGWTDLGGDRFNTANQNSVWTPESLSYMNYPAAYTMGNSGKNIVDSQRIIAASVSMSKEVQILERLRMQIRGDFQNPFKWYNWGSRPTTNYTSNTLNAQRNFGKIAIGNEATTNNGGVPMLNITLALVW